MLHDLGLNLVCEGPFQILGETEQDRSPPLLHIVALRFWKIVQRIKLLHNLPAFGVDALAHQAMQSRRLDYHAGGA